MIQKYKQFNESIKNLLVGPTEDEIIDQLKDTPNKLLSYSINNKFMKGIKYSIKNGADKRILLSELKLDLNEFDTIKQLISEYELNVNEFSYNIHKIIDNENELLNSDDFKFFVKNGLDISYRHYYYFRTAAYHGYLDVVKLLIKHGSRVDALNNQAIWQAAMNGHLDTVKLLEENGADITVNNYAPFRYSAGMCYLNVAEYCLTKNTPQTIIIDAIYEAEDCKQTDVVNFLKKYIKP